MTKGACGRTVSLAASTGVGTERMGLTRERRPIEVDHVTGNGVMVTTWPTHRPDGCGSMWAHQTASGLACVILRLGHHVHVLPFTVFLSLGSTRHVSYSLYLPFRARNRTLSGKTPGDLTPAAY
jgi:hypothetical protein